jgi:hypothetical protein
MNEIHIINNWLDSELACYINDKMVKVLPIYFNHILTNNVIIGAHLFTKLNFKDNDKFNTYFYDVVFENFIIDFLLFKFKQILQFEFLIDRCYLNFYPEKTHSLNFHIDSLQENAFTILYMVSKTPNDSSGAFEYIDPIDNKVKQIDFLQNRLIIFKSNIKHRGISFNDGERITLTYKCKKIDENCANN